MATQADPQPALTREEIDLRRRDARRREIVERLLPVVERKTVEEGSYLTLALDSILEGALVSRSTFYRYFKDKNELLLALIEPVLEDVRTAAIRPFDRSSAPTRDELQEELRHNFDIYRPHISLLDALVEVSYSDPVVRERFEGGFRDIHETIAKHLVDGQKAGFVKEGILPGQTAAWITWMAERGMSRLVASAGPAELDRLAASLATMVWSTVYAAPTGDQPG
jgi:TetR/AcrR family transcriptional regulator, ethionamide resistance regulator